MATLDNLEWTFEKVPELYEMIRPSYPSDLFQSIFDYHHIDENIKLLVVDKKDLHTLILDENRQQ